MTQANIRIAVWGASRATADKAKKDILLLSDKLGYQVQIVYCGDDLASLPSYFYECNILAVDVELINISANEIFPVINKLAVKAPNTSDAVGVIGYSLPIGEICFKTWVKMIPRENITIHLTKGQKIESVSDIIYFENKNRKVYAKTAYDYYATSHTMKQICEKMIKYSFISPYVSFLVNPAWVERIGSRDIILRNQENIPLSQKRAAMFRKQHRDFCKDWKA